MDGGITPRVGTFFILVGVALMVLFVGSILGEDTKIIFLASSAAALFLAYVLRRGGARPEPTRFSSIRKANQRARQRREENQAKKAPKK